MNSVGLNIFIAIVGISAGPGFVNGLKTQGIGLFLWGAVATTMPLVLGMFIAKYIFRFHDALMLGIVSGARTTTASLGLVCDMGKSQVPALGYTVTYAVGNTLAHDLGHGPHHAALVRTSLKGLRRHDMDLMKLRKFRDAEPVRDQGRADQARQEDLANARSRRFSTPAAATPTGSPPRRARASSCSASSRSPRASG